VPSVKGFHGRAYLQNIIEVLAEKTCQISCPLYKNKAGWSCFIWTTNFANIKDLVLPICFVYLFFSAKQNFSRPRRISAESRYGFILQ